MAFTHAYKGVVLCHILIGAGSMEKDTVSAWEDVLVGYFIADILKRTLHIANGTLHRQAVQAFVDE